MNFTASLDSVSDTWNYNRDYAYANGLTFAVEDLEIDKRRTIAQEGIGPFEEE